MKLILRTPNLRAQAIRAIQALPLDQVYECELKPWKATRSSEQNRRYWSLLTEISEQLKPDGKHYSPETWHRYFKTKFLGMDVIVVDGEPTLIEKSTTKEDVPNFGDYMTQIEAWGSEHGVQFTAWEYQA